MFTDERPAWVGIVRSELRMDHARWVRMASMTGCATFLATMFLVFRVPLPAYGAYVVLMAAQRDVVTSITLSTRPAVQNTFMSAARVTPNVD